jgi:hypothetical protein
MTKTQIPIKSQILQGDAKTAEFEPLDIGHWTLIGIWGLVIGHFFG